MTGPPVSIGCAVLLSPGAAGPPDSGMIAVITQVTATAGGLHACVVDRGDSPGLESERSTDSVHRSAKVVGSFLLPEPRGVGRRPRGQAAAGA